MTQTQADLAEQAIFRNALNADDLAMLRQALGLADYTGHATINTNGGKDKARAVPRRAAKR